jgi:hypothetical protein
VASTEAPISITVKTAAGSLVTVRAEHGEDLDHIVANSLESLRSAVVELEGVVRNGAPAAQPMAPAQVAAALGASIIDNTPADNGGWSAAPSIGGKNCPHGKMTAIQGTGKDGKTYRGYFCPAPKGAFDKCKNVYVRAGSAEWNTFVAEQVK